MTARRVWFLNGGILMAVALIVLAVFGVMALRRPPPEVPFEPLQASTAWSSFVREQVATLASTASSAQIHDVRESLQQLRVASEDREIHLSLVLALLAWEQGQDGAETRVRTILSHIK
jgi:hypothetical protein